ncbi:hypothetical protein C7E12_22215, partial [Stenotrophomonas maltophilia]
MRLGDVPTLKGRRVVAIELEVARVIGARAQGESKTLYPQQWARKAVRLGDVPTLKGRRVVAIELEVA